jgi:adenylate cyclase
MALEAEPVTHLMRGTYLFATGGAAALLAWQVRVRVGVAVRAALDHSRVVGIFGRYLHEDVVDRLINAPDGLRLGGQRRMLTVMMTDLRGFSALSERNPPERVMSLLNHYFGRMIPLILEEGGTIDEILGDAIVVLWNAPLDQPDHATRALRCALRLQVEMETVNAWAAAEGLPALEMGVGLHSGEAVVGNIGAPQRQKYGVVGTTINLAARVESATVGGEVLATLAVIAQVEASALHIAERRSLRPKGASEPLEVASVQGLGDLRLPARDEALVAVAPRAVTLFLFKGKELDPEPIVAELVALGPQAVAVRCAAPLDGQSDVLLRIEPGVEAAARVRPRPDGALLRLTSAESARQVHKALASP